MYLTSLSVLNSLDYEIIEMQSKSGYILFRTGAKDYIMTVTAITPVTSNIKILLQTAFIQQAPLFKKKQSLTSWN